jgi:hypothetical protein
VRAAHGLPPQLRGCALQPAPKARRTLIRKLTWQGSLDYVTDVQAATVLNREAAGTFQIEFQSSDRLAFDHATVFETGLPL